MEQKKLTLAQWQKIHPDAIRFKAVANKLLSTTEIIQQALGVNKVGKILQDSTWATANPRTGVKVNINVIISESAVTKPIIGGLAPMKG